MLLERNYFVMTNQIQILLATYNGEAYLIELLDSLLMQDFVGWKILACDDHSSDHTLPILLSFKRQNPELIDIVYTDQPFRSARDNFFFLLSKSTANYIFFCDQDDVWNPIKLRAFITRFEAIEKLQIKPNIPILIHSDLSVVNSKLDCLAHSMNAAHLNLKCNATKQIALYFNPFTGCALAINRPLVNLTRVEEVAIMHDWWIALTALFVDAQVSYIDCPLVLYRQHSDNVCGTLQASFIDLLCKNFLRLPQYIERSRIAWHQARYFKKIKFSSYLIHKLFFELSRHLRFSLHTFSDSRRQT